MKRNRKKNLTMMNWNLWHKSNQEWVKNQPTCLKVNFINFLNHYFCNSHCCWCLIFIWFFLGDNEDDVVVIEDDNAMVGVQRMTSNNYLDDEDWLTPPLRSYMKMVLLCRWFDRLLYSCMDVVVNMLMLFRIFLLNIWNYVGLYLLSCLISNWLDYGFTCWHQ